MPAVHGPRLMLPMSVEDSQRTGGGIITYASSCHACGQASSTRFGRFDQAIGLIALVFTRTYSGEFCARCTRRIHRQTLVVNLLLGWWSVVSLLVIPVFLIRNRKCYRRMLAEFSTASTKPGEAASIGQLPWASMIGIEDSTNVGQRALTLPVTLATLVAFVVLSFLVTTLATFGPSPLLPLNVSVAGLAISLAAFAGCIYWHRRRRNHASLAPDLLAELFPTPAIMHAGRVHLVGFGFQSADIFRIVICVQNLFDQPTHFSAAIGGAIAAPALEIDLPPAAVSLARFDSMIEPVGATRPLKLEVSASTRGAGGAQIRFADRRALRSRSQTHALSFAMALAGHGELDLSRRGPQSSLTFLGDDGSLESLLVPFEPTAGARSSSPSWKLVELWDAMRANNTSDAARTIMEVLR